MGSTLNLYDIYQVPLWQELEEVKANPIECSLGNIMAIFQKEFPEQRRASLLRLLLIVITVLTADLPETCSEKYKIVGGRLCSQKRMPAQGRCPVLLCGGGRGEGFQAHMHLCVF